MKLLRWPRRVLIWFAVPVPLEESTTLRQGLQIYQHVAKRLAVLSIAGYLLGVALDVYHVHFTPPPPCEVWEFRLHGVCTPWAEPGTVWNPPRE